MDKNMSFTDENQPLGTPNLKIRKHL